MKKTIRTWILREGKNRKGKGGGEYGGPKTRKKAGRYSLVYSFFSNKCFDLINGLSGKPPTGYGAPWMEFKLNVT